MNKKTLQITALLLATTTAPLYCGKKGLKPDHNQSKITSPFKTVIQKRRAHIKETIQRKLAVLAQREARLEQEQLFLQKRVNNWGRNYEPDTTAADMTKLREVEKQITQMKKQYSMENNRNEPSLPKPKIVPLEMQADTPPTNRPLCPKQKSIYKVAKQAGSTYQSAALRDYWNLHGMPKRMDFFQDTQNEDQNNQ